MGNAVFKSVPSFLVCVCVCENILIGGQLSCCNASRYVSLFPPAFYFPEDIPIIISFVQGAVA